MTDTTTKLDDTDFEAALLQMISRQVADTVVRESTVKDIDLDSLDVVELVHTVDAELGVRISAFDLVHAKTVGEIVDTVADKRSVSDDR
nr:phosphopantetheine-binding protein [Rhodococcus sp. (in: high G+C Gram-positive bacteria)]